MNQLMLACAKSGLVDEATKLFQTMSSCNMISWDKMIAGYVHNKHIEEALEVF